MDDTKTTIQDLRDKVRRFNDDCDWQQFHTPQNLAVSIAIEAAELLAHLQWTDEPASDQLPQLCEELADVVIYCLSMANTLGIDISQEVRRKLARNDAKYPADEYRGRF
jgi:NTP pyrophosphatase (non-canonical NTP hydrolase)